jgi:hypothetical protein
MKLLKKLNWFILAIVVPFAMFSCGNKEEKVVENSDTKQKIAAIQAEIDKFAPVKIEADLSHLTEREKQLVAKLAEAGKICNDIFWHQSSHDAIAVRDSLAKLNDDFSKKTLELVNIYYGPYDKMNEYKRFVDFKVGTFGAEKRPATGGFYPEDMTKEEFEKHISENPADKEAFESLYTVIVRDENKKLKAIPYNEYYNQYDKSIEKLVKLLAEAAELCDNPSLKKYLELRAEAIKTDKYFDSDWAWMDLQDNNIDVVIGPIESYEDGLYNYKTAHEAVVMVKDVEGTKELEMFKNSIGEFQNQLPWDKKYYVPAQVGGTVLQMMNVVYFGGDCNKATKTIAAALPNDPNVYEKKGGKKSMYKNMMEAKFDKVLKPIADIMLAPELREFVSKKHLVSFVTLHEVSHNLGRGFVYNSAKNAPEVSVRAALKEKYSPAEELKADIISMYSHRILFNEGKISQEELKKAIVTYIGGLFRSMRFGAESAHGIANFIQFRYLLEKGAIQKTNEGFYTFDNNVFFDKVSDLTKLILTIQADGDYKKATELIEKYGNSTPEIMAEFEKVKSVPADLNSTYMY